MKLLLAVCPVSIIKLIQNAFFQHVLEEEATLYVVTMRLLVKAQAQPIVEDTG
jgi:hypothetical protein